jgi:hypothetical protein
MLLTYFEVFNAIYLRCGAVVFTIPPLPTSLAVSTHVCMFIFCLPAMLLMYACFIYSVCVESKAGGLFSSFIFYMLVGRAAGGDT